MPVLVVLSGELSARTSCVRHRYATTRCITVVFMPHSADECHLCLFEVLLTFVPLVLSCVKYMSMRGRFKVNLLR